MGVVRWPSGDGLTSGRITEKNMKKQQMSRVESDVDVGRTSAIILFEPQGSR